MSAAALRGRLSAARRIVRNACIDSRFGRPLGFIYVRNRKQSNSDYLDLEMVFEDSVDAQAVFVDVGCGAGRVINQWLRMGVESQIYGIELDEQVSSSTRRRLRRFKNVSIITGDAVANLPSDGTEFFLFNPFDEATVRRFADAIPTIPAAANGNVTIRYLNCKYVTVFQDDPNFVVDVVELGSPDSSRSQQFATVTVRQFTHGG